MAIKKEDIKIRDATVWDAKAIADMWELEMAEMQMPGRYCDDVEKERFFLDVIIKIKKQIGTAWVLVAEYRGNIVSFITGRVNYQDIGTSHLIGYCEHIYVCPEYRKLSIGKKMMEELIEKSIKVGAEDLQFCIKYEDKKVKAYERMGFKPFQIIFRKDVKR